jgi:methylated-DNA-protein-cysteine methyltransferase-like protein
VGRVLGELEEQPAVPWFRVVGAGGRIAARAVPGCDELQRVLLEAEGVRFSSAGHFQLDDYRWRPRRR